MLTSPSLPPFVCRCALLPLLLSLTLYYALARGDIASRAPAVPASRCLPMAQHRRRCRCCVHWPWALRSLFCCKGGPMNNEIIEEEERIAEERALAEMRLAMAGLHRPVGELPTLAAALTCERSATVRQAIVAMQRAHTGCLLILDQGHLVGIFTERDVLSKVAAQDVDIDQLLVGALMTPQPEC